MIETLVYRLIGSPSERRLKKLQPFLGQINALEAEVQKLPAEAFPAKTEEFRARIRESLAELPADLEKAERVSRTNAILDEVLPEAFALVREASRRAIGLRHFDVQMVGGMVLHYSGIAEMKTGEGKTLVATAPVYLNALLGRGVHVVTVNDYLAKRDCEWMGPIYRYLGLTVGFVQHDMDNALRRQSYGSDVTYITNNELGFDYLRDNMVVHGEDRVLRPLCYAIVDEVDSILIDEARTPLIISGPAEESTDRYALINKIIPHLKTRFVTEEEEIQSKYTGEDLGKGFDAIIDEKNHSAVLTDQGIDKAQHLLGITSLYDDLQGAWVHHITQALRAHHLYKRDVEYVIKDSEIIIVDEFTGRLMPGRRWSEGLHQAVEAKENLPIKEENQTLATITFQNFFKLFDKVAGMTGTAMTEADEFFEIYKLDVVEMPPNRPNVREDFPDIVYLNERAKDRAIIAEVSELWRKGRPVLVGTRSIERSEKLAAMLRAKGVPHQVLNAKYHEMEAQIIAQAGRKAAVTIATNMAGRGTDIILGGTPPDSENQKEVVALGGLHVLGTERHESRRIDNQLRGRCGRQGDPGSSRFYIGLDDELMRLFGSERITSLMQTFGMTEDEPIESGLVSRQIEGAQRRVETHNFDIRKQLLDFDNVMNKQREVIYGLRNRILDGQDVTEQLGRMMEEEATEKVSLWAKKDSYPEQWDISSLSAYMQRVYGVDFRPPMEELKKHDPGSLLEHVRSLVDEAYRRREKEEFAGFDFRHIEKMVLLQVIDQAWKIHLYDLDHMKKYIHLRAYGQKDPKVEYQRESFSLFNEMLDRIREQTIEYIFRIQAPREPVAATVTQQSSSEGEARASGSAAQPRKPAAQPERPSINKIGRNDPCPCGSGKKYKKCCGA